MTDTLTRNAMCVDIAEALQADADGIAPDDSLLDHGLDSMRVMALLLKWEERVPGLDFSRFMEVETLDEWWQIVAEAQAR